MIPFEHLKLDDSAPIYLQIIGYIKRGIASGTIGDGDEMPSRRVLSALLGVNPNTVQKAYAMLEEQGLIHSRSGAKSCIAIRPETVEQIRDELLEEAMKHMISAMKQMGVSREEAAELIGRYWEV